MTLIGVISDTHGRLNVSAYNALADCEHIIHAGDICGTDILRELETIAPVTAVLGNNDYAEYGAHVQRYARPVIDGVKFLVAHYPHDVVLTPAPRKFLRSFSSSALAPGDPIPDVCIHGHTHMPRLEYGKDARPALFVLNPGSASWPRGGSQASIAKIEVANGIVLRIRIEALDGSIVASVG